MHPNDFLFKLVAMLNIYTTTVNRVCCIKIKSKIVTVFATVLGDLSLSVAWLYGVGRDRDSVRSSRVSLLGQKRGKTVG